MQRRHFLGLATSITGAIVFTNNLLAHTVPNQTSLNFEPLTHPHDYWKDKVSGAAYNILFKEGTERPGSSALNNNKATGTYICAACYLPLFESSTKYNSGTGWPSFYQPIEKATATKVDLKLILPRTEYHCARCGGHQGHVFNDGPEPTGKRYCNNGLALNFVASNEDLPALRG